MKIKKYKKEDIYSYSLGAFPTIELIKNKKEYIISIYIHSSFDNLEIIEFISKNISKDKIIHDDKIFKILSEKENVYVIGVFKKYDMNLDNKDHLLLDNPSNMGNLGTIIRSSLGFDIFNIALVSSSLDYFNPKVIRASMGAIFSLNIEVFNSLKEYKNKFKEHKIYSFMLDASLELGKFDFDKNLITLAFGNEGSGLPSLYHEENPVIIRHNSLIDSLNITNAISIALYEYRKNR